MIDLHTHTVFSDGTTTPEQNAALAAAEGLSGLALTDHDTLAGWAQAAEACARHRLTFVPGIELSTEVAGSSVHILGYWCDPAHPGLVAECHRLRNERSRRAERILARLAELGVDCSPEQVRAHAGGAPVGRPHIAAAMVDAGVVPDLRTAFDDYLRDGGPAYVPKHALAPADGVRLIRAAGGAAVIAHPGLETRATATGTTLVEELCAVGLAGVEADHPGHDAETAAFWRAFARERELLATGCSDFHGDRKPVKIGERTTAPGTVEALRERCAPAHAAVERKEGPW
ncbi:MAG TPA: PHP domain-containing protein [Egibacteraceae bacterium]|nr:PHP domain-containing protein [Egibacteraceae bacterium]